MRAERWVTARLPSAQADRLSQGLLGDVSLKEWAAKQLTGRITRQLSGKALKQYYDGEYTNRHQ